MITTFKPYWHRAQRNAKDPQNRYTRININRPSCVKLYNRGMGGTDSEDHKLALYRTSVISRKWPHRIIFHFLLAAMLNAHILYKLKNHLEYGDYLYEVGDWIIAAASEMREKGNQRVEPQVVGRGPAENIKIANKDSLWTTWERCPSRLEHGHFPVTYRLQGVHSTRRHCKMPNCDRQIQTYCRRCEIPLCTDDLGGSSCFEIFHTRKRLGPPVPGP
jgi:hypothetical protein